AGAWYTYRLALSIYGRPVAQLATLIYVSAAHLVISNNDVRAEPYLTGLVIGSVFHFYKVSRSTLSGKWFSGNPAVFRELAAHLVAGSFMAACAIMTKGPFVLITISSGLVLDWILGKQWGQFRNLRWWIALLLITLFITPELYCLYIQFDLHPEKVVFGHTGVSGIRFFFWDSQFGRFFNTGPIKGSGDPFFYFHTLLWAFLPWSLLLYAAVIQKSRKNNCDTVRGDAICLGSATASFLVFSLSRFQLPHYLNILFPFFSILTAGYLYQLRRKKVQNIVALIQQGITILLPLLLLFLCWFFHFNGWIYIAAGIAALSILSFRVYQGNDLPVVMAKNFWAALLAFAFVNFCLYPAILRYQAGTAAGDSLRSVKSLSPVETTTGSRASAGSGKGSQALAASHTVYMLQEAPANYSFEFYSPLPVQRLPFDSLPRSETMVFLPSAFTDTLRQKGFRIEEIHSFPNFHISQLTGEFLNYKTRPATLEKYSLVRVTGL
ncbi:MAG: glycosyl transferase, partial [Bacteroidota bacterium]